MCKVRITSFTEHVDKAHMSVRIGIKRAANRKTLVVMFLIATLDYGESITVILK